LKIDTIDEPLADVLAQDGLMAGVAAFVGIVAVLLAWIGLYGLVAHMTAQRTSEIGIRMALGATTGAVRR
jgi:ABC-type antimicrobial peptide transport system permease subunit